MTEMQDLLKIPHQQLESLNDVLLDGNSAVMNEFLAVVAKYGTPDEINQKHRESRTLESLFSKIKKKAPSYIDDLKWLIEQRFNISPGCA